ncbi:MAG TPA: hypothetical protein VHZ96_26505 [Frankiaceae bacterium]|jgi:hypothetical protein|nr:hypothetical protein [Frankiaceae bacterium]
MSTPFYEGAVAYEGADPGDPIFYPDDDPHFWIGKPGLMMVELPSLGADNYTATAAAGEVEQPLMGGGSGIDRFASQTRRWTLAWPSIGGRDLQTVMALASWDLLGPPPWVYLGPEDNNRLTRVQSLCGARDGDVSGWLSSDGDVDFEPSVAPRVFPGGVMAWAPGSSGAILAAGADGDTAGNPDVDHAAPVLPGMPATPIFWARCSTGTATLKARLSGRLADGTIDTEADGPDVDLDDTEWLPLYVTAEAGTLGASQYLVPELVCVTAGDVLVCNPDLRYTDLPGDFELGGGAPRVAGPFDYARPVDVHRWSPIGLTLAETITGAL